MWCIHGPAARYIGAGGVPGWEYHVDNMAQQLVKNPQLFDHKVLVSTNLFIDIISEACAGLIGSIGLVHSANIGDDYAMFEPAHGSAPKYKGMDKVDPCATILAGACMLRYLGADAIIRATEQTIAEAQPRMILVEART